MNMNKKNRMFVCLMAIAMVMMSLLPSCYGGAIECKEEKLEIDNNIDSNIIIDDDNAINDNAIVLDGNIVADVGSDRLRVVRPSINLTDGQTIDFNANETSNGTYLIDKTLQINIDVINGTNDNTILGRYITTCIILVKKDRPLISGLLKNLFLGKILNINRTNVFSEGEKYIEIPLLYETDETSENIVMHILAIGTIFASKGQPTITHKKIDLKFVYSSESPPPDTTPPVTICILDGEQIEKDVYTGEVIASLEAYDEESEIEQTMQRFDYFNPDGAGISSSWGEYNKSLVFSNKGKYIIHFYSIDTAENIELEKTRNFHIF